jgi:hypothetical protein
MFMGGLGREKSVPCVIPRPPRGAQPGSGDHPVFVMQPSRISRALSPVDGRRADDGGGVGRVKWAVARGRL